MTRILQHLAPRPAEGVHSPQILKNGKNQVSNHNYFMQNKPNYRPFSLKNRVLWKKQTQTNPIQTQSCPPQADFSIENGHWRMNQSQTNPISRLQRPVFNNDPKTFPAPQFLINLVNANPFCYKHSSIITNLTEMDFGRSLCLLH